MRTGPVHPEAVSGLRAENVPVSQDRRLSLASLAADSGATHDSNITTSLQAGVTVLSV